MATINIPPGYIPLYEPSPWPGKRGRLLAFYDPVRRVLSIKRSDGPKCEFDLTRIAQTQGENVTQEPGSVL